MMDTSRLIQVQERIAKSVIVKDFSRGNLFDSVGGFDVSYSGDMLFCAGIVMDYESLDVIEEKTYISKALFPYIPTFFAFREGWPIIKTYMTLKNRPDLIFINGHGISHPRFCGIASHVGVLINKPTIGVAQNLLVGEFCGREKERIIYKGRHVGWIYKNKPFKEIFISPGHMVSVESSLEITLKVIRGHKLPEPLRLAHELAGRVKMEYDDTKD